MIAAVIGALESSLAEVLVRVADGLQVSGGEVIDIRSTIAIAPHPQTSAPGIRDAFEASLSLAA
jgi:hypothetical protein